MIMMMMDESFFFFQYHELNISTHCGVVPAANEDFYTGTEISPFGKYPFVVVIEDDYYVSV